MCDSCGCGQLENTVIIRKPGEKLHIHPHEHDHRHSREHGSTLPPAHSHEESRTIGIEQDILSKNNLIAERNRGFFEAKGVLTLNLVSSPGSGKTTILEKTIGGINGKISLAVIEGDQQTTRDADRIHATGIPVVQVNTGTGCHLDAKMIDRAIKVLNPVENTVLLIENVGNLICPALFDLGEAHMVVIISVTEGDDKPQKYPTMFDAADICIINKIDLLPYVEFDLNQCKQYALEVNHHLTFFEVSAKTGYGMEAWNDWILQQIKPS